MYQPVFCGNTMGYAPMIAWRKGVGSSAARRALPYWGGESVGESLYMTASMTVCCGVKMVVVPSGCGRFDWSSQRFVYSVGAPGRVLTHAYCMSSSDWECVIATVMPSKDATG